MNSIVQIKQKFAGFSGAALTRDKADTLLLIATCSLVLFPFAEHTPFWLSLIAALLIAWRIWLTLRGQSLPGKWLLTSIALALLAVVYAQFHTWLGKDAGIAFLIILVCLKMLELHARRDAVSVLFVCYFLLVGQLLYSQSLLSAGYLLLCMGLLISTQFTFQYHQLIPPFSKRLLSGYKIVGLAIPLALILFLFFPRIQGPLWGKQQGNVGGITGLSDTMEPGNVAELALSDQIAFRVRFAGKFANTPPPPSQLYWRGIVLDTFNGSRWSVSRLSSLPVTSAPTQGIPVIQDILMEPHNQRWLFGLDRPDSLTSYNGKTVADQDYQYGRLTPYGEMRSPDRIQDRIRYTIKSYLSSPAAANTLTAAPMSERVELQNRALQLPPGYNPITIQWAQQLRQKTDKPVQLANLVLNFFREQPFRYTLSPPPLGVNQIDDFMFGTQAGFCEHYASAFVVIMRAMHIPARVVTGYQGGETNSVDGLMTVRQSDAHAWAEIWLDDRGWVRVDPTAAVAPNRVEHGINGSFPNRGLTSLINFSRTSWIADFARQLRSQWDATNSAWNLWVLNYSLDKQINLLSALSGIEHPQAAQLGIAMMVAASLIVAILSFILLGKRTAATPLDRAYIKFCRHMDSVGHGRLPHEGALDYCRRLQSVFPNRSELIDFLTLYANCKYGRGYNPDQLTQLKQLLKLCLQLKPSRANSSSIN